MAFARHTVAYFYVLYAWTHLCHNAYVFMAYGHRSLYCFLAPFVPLVDMQVGTADGGFPYFYQHVVDTDFWNWDILHPDAFLCFFLN